MEDDLAAGLAIWKERCDWMPLRCSTVTDIEGVIAHAADKNVWQAGKVLWMLTGCRRS